MCIRDRNKIKPEGYQQYTLFQDSIKAEKERHLQEAVLQVKTVSYTHLDVYKRQGIKEAIAAAFPKTEYQRCIVHQVRNLSLIHI